MCIMKTIKIVFTTILLGTVVASCNHNRDNTTFGGSKDTTSINKAGGPAIADTAAISANQKNKGLDSTKNTITAKGNIDPTGHTPKK